MRRVELSSFFSSAGAFVSGFLGAGLAAFWGTGALEGAGLERAGLAVEVVFEGPWALEEEGAALEDVAEAFFCISCA